MFIEVIVIVLLFVTAWVILVLAARHLGQRRPLVTGPHRNPAPAPGPRTLPAAIRAARGPCCLEVPCSPECARLHQEMQDRLARRYDLMVAEATKLVAAQMQGGGSPDS